MTPRFTMSAEEVTRRINARACLGCGISPLELDIETGFPRHFCVNCQDRLNRQPGPKVGAARSRREHREQGLANLDRLLKE